MDVLVKLDKLTDAESGAINAKIIRINRNQPANQHFGSAELYYADMIRKDVGMAVVDFARTEKARKAFSEWYAKATPDEIIAFLSQLPGGIPS